MAKTKASSTSGTSKSSTPFYYGSLNCSSRANGVVVEAWEIHGFAGYQWHRDVRFPDIEPGTDNRVMNIYSLFPGHKDFVYEDEWRERRTFLVDTGIHLTIPDKYCLYVWTDSFIEKEYNLRLPKTKLNGPEYRIYTGNVFPFIIPLEAAHRKKKVVIKNKELIARAYLIPFPEIDTINMRADWWPEASNIPCSIIRIKKVGETKNGSGCSGGSGYHKPINTNSIS